MTFFVEKGAENPGRFLHDDEVGGQSVVLFATEAARSVIGVPMVKKHIDEIQTAGEGALFVDEAFQLTAQHNYGGNDVHDFLLAEIENYVGKIVFIFAGYNKEMEKFFLA